MLPQFPGKECPCNLHSVSAAVHCTCTPSQSEHNSPFAFRRSRERSRRLLKSTGSDVAPSGRRGLKKIAAPMIKPLIPEGANRAVYTTPELIGPREPRKRTTGGPRSETEQCRRSLLCANRTGRAPNKMRRRSRRSISFYCGIVPPSWRGPTVRPIRCSRSRSRVASR